MAFGPKSPKVWVFDLDAPAGESARTFAGSATAAIFSPDGTRLAVGYVDGTTVVWQVAK